MSQFSAIIDDFSQGEVSPLTLAKLSSAEVKNGLDLNINMVPDPHGPLVGRQGMKHLGDIPATDLNATLFDFEMYEGKTLTIAFYDDQVTIYNVSAGVPTTTTLTTPYTAATLHGADRDRHNVEGVKTPDGTQMYFLHDSVVPWVMTIADADPISDTALDVTFAAVSFDIDNPWDSSKVDENGDPILEADWDDPLDTTPEEWGGVNFPTCMTFFQDRAWFGGCRNNPETFWGSKTGAGNYGNLNLGTLADDAVRFTLQKEGLIKWLSGHSTLLVGSDYGEFIASGSAVTIEPNDIQIEPQSAYGSRRITPEFIGDEVLYVSTDGRKLRSMWWRWVESGWKSIDLTFTGEHLTFGGIKDIAYSRDPSSIIWLLTGTGSLVCCSFRRKNDNDPIVGWGRVELNDKIGAITGMCSVQNAGLSSVVIAARVTVDGVERLHLMQQDAKDIYSDDIVILDNYSEHTPVNRMITGLEYLEGEEVEIVGDGANLPAQTVVSGALTLTEEYSTVRVGHWYRQKVITLPYFVYEKQLGHQHKSWNKISCFTYNSFPPLINGKRNGTRHPSTTMGEGESGVTGMIDVYSKGWDRLAQITIEQDVPKHLIVLGIFGEVNFE